MEKQQGPQSTQEGGGESVPRGRFENEEKEKGLVGRYRDEPGSTTVGNQPDAPTVVDTVPWLAEELLLQGGDESAFEELVRRHQQRVFRLLMRMMGNRDEAEEVAQEAFISLYRHGCKPIPRVQRVAQPRLQRLRRRAELPRRLLRLAGGLGRERAARERAAERPHFQSSTW